MKREKRKYSLLLQVSVLFLIGVILTGILTYICETYLYDKSVKRQTELHASEIAEETKRAVKEYPAYEWLLRYWYSHPGELDIEYDSDFSAGTRTEQKCREFNSRHPDMQLKYLSGIQADALSAEDQKLFAEIVYSWLITRVDQIKQAYHVDYLFCVVSEEPFEKQFFLFSAADPGAVRGTNYEEVYPLGNVVSISGSQSEAMCSAIINSNHLADAGSYVDYYSFLTAFDGHSAMIGLTYDLSALRGDIRAQTRTGATLAIVNQFILSAVCLALIWAFVLRPLKKVQSSIRSYKTTKDSGAVTEELSEVRSRNEIGVLAEDVTEMVHEIDDHVDRIREITAQTERISTELALATRLQAAFLPSIFPPFPDRKEFDIYASMDPAKEVGGDFYDFYLIDDDHLCLTIADVSGKGIPAALFMMVSKIILQSCTMLGQSAGEVLTKTNEAICSNNKESMFVTVWIGILEISTGKLTCANAGHEYPAIMKNGRFELYKDKHGFVIGGMEGLKYKEYELMLEPGDKLFVYTDGVPEASDENKALFGAERMLGALNAAAGASPEELLGAVRKAVDGFVGSAEQFDDLTMLCIEYKGADK